MKAFKRVIFWIFLSLIIQFGGLFYLDKFYFASSSDLKAKKVEENNETKKPTAEIKVNEESKKISLSYNGKYLTFVEGNEVKVINTTTDSTKIVQCKKGATLSYYKWLSDRNRFILAEKEVGNNGGIIKFYSYDADKDAKEEITETAHNISTFIKLPSSKSQVEDVVMSTLPNVMYAKISNSGLRSSIYRFDIMAEMSKVQNTDYVIGKIGVTTVEDHLIYEDLTYKRIRTSNGTQVKIKGVTNPCFIATDSDDRIYVAQVEKDNTIKNIYYGNLKDNADSYKSIQLINPIPKEDAKDIYVSPSGNIYINDNLNGIVTEVNSGKETKYKGIFVKMFTTGVASISDGKLIKTEY